MRNLLFFITKQKTNNFHLPFSIVGKFIKIRTFLSSFGREMRHKGLCLSFRHKRNFFSATIKIRNKAFGSDTSFFIFNPNLKLYLPGEDGIRTHG
jgi:hypothetical protein